MRIWGRVVTGWCAGLVATSAFAQEAAPPPMTPQKIAEASQALALKVGDDLAAACKVRPEPDQSVYLKTIADGMANVDMAVITAALDWLMKDQLLCPGAQTAVKSAVEASQLAEAASTAPTGAINTPSGSPFSTGGGGAPGGGGGAGYITPAG